MNYKEKLSAMQEFVGNNIEDVEQLCKMFDITLDEMIAAFPDKLVSHYGRVYGTEDDEEEFEGFRVFTPEDEE